MRFTKSVSVAIAGAIAVTTLVGCSSGRSVEALCGVVSKHKDSYLSSMQGAAKGGNILKSMTDVVGAIGALKTMWRDMADVAPDEIKNDISLVSEGWEAREKAALEGNLVGVLSSAVTDAQILGQVNTYVTENCGTEYRMF